MPRRCDIWRVGVVRSPIAAIASSCAIAQPDVTWLAEEPSFRFLADPFGLWRDGQLHLFAETYDYRTRHGVIDHLMLDAEFRVTARETVLREPWHLSYPYVFAADGEIWMLPEAGRSGGLTLYRAADFPSRWEAAARIALDPTPLDATPLHHDGRWWLFYSGGPTRAARMGSLHAAWAERLTGPWHLHPGNPLRTDLAGSRPGGTPFEVDGKLGLPVQDCTKTYGGAVRILWIDRLSPTSFEASLEPPLQAPGGIGYDGGMHTLAACGEITLIDVKRVDRTGRGWLLDLNRSLKRLRSSR